jgi:hypothetical protein
VTIKPANPDKDIYQLKVTLLGARPPIWRRLLVDPDMTLAQLHDVLQITMGWEDSHMHEFRAGEQRFGQPEPADPFTRTPRAESERTARLRAVLKKAGAKIIYTYDFGDSWEHSIVLEKLLPADPSISCPLCTDGKLACPPGDCGGIPGYYGLLEAINNPDDESSEEMRDWVGDDFDPQAFSIDKSTGSYPQSPAAGKAAGLSQDSRSLRPTTVREVRLFLTEKPRMVHLLRAACA